MMAVGSAIAVVCLESVENPTEREHLDDNLKKSGLHVIPITREQMNNFCGNCIELKGTAGKKVMCMSERAYNNFTHYKKNTMLKYVNEIVHADLTNIETIGGGSLRCMIGELF